MPCGCEEHLEQDGAEYCLSLLPPKLAACQLWAARNPDAIVQARGHGLAFGHTPSVVADDDMQVVCSCECGWAPVVR